MNNITNYIEERKYDIWQLKLPGNINLCNIRKTCESNCLLQPWPLAQRLDVTFVVIRESNDFLTFMDLDFHFNWHWIFGLWFRWGNLVTENSSESATSFATTTRPSPSTDGKSLCLTTLTSPSPSPSPSTTTATATTSWNKCSVTSVTCLQFIWEVNCWQSITC